MSTCSNCYNGCVETVSDKCVMYTGVDVPVLGIKKGDSLSYVEQALVTFLTSTLDGSGITITIDEDIYCSLVSDYLQACETVTALDLFKALVQAACNIQGQIDTINATLATLNADYDVDCLDGVTDTSDTHDVVQAIITKLCSIDTTLTALTVSLPLTYVAISEIDSYIEAYLASLPSSTRYSAKMIPYVAVPYFGSVSNFDATGAGIAGTDWEDIYLCNGDNGTPDLRGRTVVGATSTPSVLPMSSVVDPASDPTFNPSYTVSAPAGANKITLDTTQIPSHNHTVTDPEHTHFVSNEDTSAVALDNTLSLSRVNTSGGDGPSYYLHGSITEPTIGISSPSATDISIDSTGGGLAHSNVQPGTGAYFIMYIP